MREKPRSPEGIFLIKIYRIIFWEKFYENVKNEDTIFREKSSCYKGVSLIKIYEIIIRKIYKTLKMQKSWYFQDIYFILIQEISLKFIIIKNHNMVVCVENL